MLKGVRHLSICGLSLVKDVSQLKDCISLDLSECINVNTVNELKNCVSLNLTRCLGITDVSCLSLGNVETLILDGCTNASGINALGNVKNLSLIACWQLRNNDILDFNCQSLNIAGCFQLTDSVYTSLKHISRLILN